MHIIDEDQDNLQEKGSDTITDKDHDIKKFIRESQQGRLTGGL
jgi:hypothetical protein